MRLHAGNNIVIHNIAKGPANFFFTSRFDVNKLGTIGALHSLFGAEVDHLLAHTFYTEYCSQVYIYKHGDDAQYNSR
jgi:hypothetical protein